MRRKAAGHTPDSQVTLISVIKRNISRPNKGFFLISALQSRRGFIKLEILNERNSSKRYTPDGKITPG